MAGIPIPCSCGIDIGSTASQVSLAFAGPDGRKQIFRVWADFHGPNRPNPLHNGTSPCDFPADVALDPENGGFIQGRLAQESIDRFAIKTIIAVRAGMRSPDTLSNLPRGDEFWALYRAKVVTKKMIDAVVVEHFASLRDEAIKKIDQNAQRMVINNVIFTYPNYLPGGSDEEFEAWVDYVRRRWSEVWVTYNPNIKLHRASEGQAIGCYIAETFQDQNNSFTHGQLKRNLGFSEEHPIQPVLVVDAGGSSVNIQIVILKFDEFGELECGQSSWVDDAISGVQGGSDLSNCKVREFILERCGEDYPDANVSALLADWEYQKKGIDYTQARAITVSDRNGCELVLSPETIRDIFQQTLKPVLDVVKHEVRRLVNFEKRLGVIFCGGSFSDLGLRWEIEKYMNRKVLDAKKKRRVVNYCFLAECEEKWSSAVSAGAAVSLIRMPLPFTLLSRTALGIHRKTLANDEWEEERRAEVLFLMPQPRRDDRAVFTAGISSVGMANHESPRAQYSLVCDPNYADNLSKSGGLGQSSIQRGRDSRRPEAGASGIQNRPIELPFVNKSTSGDLGPYDIGFSIDGLDLPRGKIRWQLDIEYFGFPARSSVADMNLSEDSRIEATLRCCHVDEGGREAYDELNKEWKLVIETDPASHLLKVAEDNLVE